MKKEVKGEWESQGKVVGTDRSCTPTDRLGSGSGSCLALRPVARPHRSCNFPLHLLRAVLWLVVKAMAQRGL